MLIKPKLNYQLMGTDFKLNQDNIYKAVKAINLPEYKEKGKIFVISKGQSMMLEKGEYTIIN